MKKILLVLIALGAFSIVSIMPGCDGGGGSHSSTPAADNKSSDTMEKNQDQNNKGH